MRRLIGYCPQHDALLDKLTVHEHLAMFGRIKGVRSDVLDQFVSDMVTTLSWWGQETIKSGFKRQSKNTS